MGKKIVHATIGLTGVSAFIGCVALCLPFHSLWWFAAFVPLFKMETHVLSVEVKCTVSASLCGELEGNPNLEDFAQRSCAAFVKGAVMNLCEGAHNAYLVGLILVIVFVMNLMLQGAAVYSFNYYMTASMRKKYRKLGVILQSLGLFFVTSALGLYFALVIVYLNGVKLKILSDVGVFSSGHGAGPTYGYILMWVSCVVQVAAILLSVIGARSSQEELIEEAREQAKFAAELGGFGEVELPSYGYGQQGMHFGAQPQMQPQQFPSYQQGMGGFQQQPGFQQPPGFQQGFGISR